MLFYFLSPSQVKKAWPQGQSRKGRRLSAILHNNIAGDCCVYQPLPAEQPLGPLEDYR